MLLAPEHGFRREVGVNGSTAPSFTDCPGFRVRLSLTITALTSPPRERPPHHQQHLRRIGLPVERRPRRGCRSRLAEALCAIGTRWRGIGGSKLKLPVEARRRFRHVTRPSMAARRRPQRSRSPLLTLQPFAERRRQISCATFVCGEVIRRAHRRPVCKLVVGCVGVGCGGRNPQRCWG